MSWPEQVWLLNRIKGGYQEFTQPGAHTFTVPAFVNQIFITACAGGGGGGYNGGYGGGGGEAIANQMFNVTPGQIINITVGGGGTGGTRGDTSTSHGATDGENTVIGTLVTLLGGQSGYNAKANGIIRRKNAGIGGSAANSSRVFSTPATDGIVGKAGYGIATYDSGSREYAGGNGGGSLGDGGNGSCGKSLDDDLIFYVSTAGDRGGGGGGGRYCGGATDTQNGSNGGSGYVKIAWGLTAI